jgi:hypothetical protein
LALVSVCSVIPAQCRFFAARQVKDSGIFAGAGLRRLPFLASSLPWRALSVQLSEPVRSSGVTPRNAT